MRSTLRCLFFDGAKTEVLPDCTGTITPEGQGIHAESRHYLDSGNDTAILQQIFSNLNLTPEV